MNWCDRCLWYLTANGETPTRTEPARCWFGVEAPQDEPCPEYQEDPDPEAA